MPVMIGSGLRLDMTIMNDGEGDDMMNESWNTFWDVATEVTDEGWFVEMKIPFSSLRFQSDGDSVIMGLIIIRQWVLNSVMIILSNQVLSDMDDGFPVKSQKYSDIACFVGEWSFQEIRITWSNLQNRNLAGI